MDQHETPPRSEKGAHSRRALSFGQEAKLYDESRPSYPAELFEWAFELAPESSTQEHPTHQTPACVSPPLEYLTVLDLGAGTGKLTSALISHTPRVIAVEPDPKMRAQFAAIHSDVPLLDGKDSDIPLPDESVDAVFVGQAWHWFDESAAAAEIQRILRPGGVLVVVWNLKDDRTDWVRQYCEIIRTNSVVTVPRPEPQVPWSNAEIAEFSWTWERSVDQLVDYAMSMSSTLTSSANQRDASKSATRAFLEGVRDSSESGGTLKLPFITRATRFQKPLPSPHQDSPPRLLEP